MNRFPPFKIDFNRCVTISHGKIMTAHSVMLRNSIRRTYLGHTSSARRCSPRRYRCVERNLPDRIVASLQMVLLLLLLLRHQRPQLLIADYLLPALHHHPQRRRCRRWLRLGRHYTDYCCSFNAQLEAMRASPILLHNCIALHSTKEIRFRWELRSRVEECVYISRKSPPPLRQWRRGYFGGGERITVVYDRCTISAAADARGTIACRSMIDDGAVFRSDDVVCSFLAGRKMSSPHSAWTHRTCNLSSFDPYFLMYFESQPQSVSVCVCVCVGECVV